MFPPRKFGIQKPAATSHKVHVKSQVVPRWAIPANVVGYTYEFGLNADLIDSLMEGQSSGTPYPTVYYTSGHRTIKHKKAGNVGWEGTERVWLFFGNVHDKWLDQEYWKDLNHTGSKLTSNQKEAFAKQLIKAAVAPIQSQSPRICTSYFDPNTKSWANQPHHGEGLLAASKASLLEIFYDAGTLSSHPSRNRFRWADHYLRPLLHDLAVEGVP